MKTLLNPLKNRFIVFFHDVFMIPVAWFSAYWLHFNLGQIPTKDLEQAAIVLPEFLVPQIAFYWLFGLYRGIWRFASLPDLIRILKATFIATSLSVLWLFLNSQLSKVPSPIFPIYTLLLFISLGGSRFLYRWFKDRIHMKAYNILPQRILIVGAGRAGESIVRNLNRHTDKKYKVLAFIDDRQSKRGREIHGVRVVGNSSDIPLIAKDLKIDLIIIAISSIRPSEMCHIIRYCEESKVTYRISPGLYDLANGSVKIETLCNVPSDLLVSDSIVLDEHKIRMDIENRIVLISLGLTSTALELCKQIAPLKPKRIILIEENEFNLYLLEHELRQQFPDINFAGYLLSLTHRTAVMQVFKENNIDIVLYAPAYKNVPMLENQLRAVMKNNILGTQFLAEAAVAHHVHKFILISSDKAVNPTSLIGATIRASEIYCQNYSFHCDTKFIILRIGNIFATNSGVMSIFRKKIEMGDPITVTHPEASRFFMTAQEATQLILQTAIIGEGGEIFVLDMKNPIKILYLAEQMISSSGLTPHQDIEIKYTGLRLGEKIHEELFYTSERPEPTLHKRILKTSYREEKNWENLISILKNINLACQINDEKLLRELLLTLVPEYKERSYFITPCHQERSEGAYECDSKIPHFARDDTWVVTT